MLAVPFFTSMYDELHIGNVHIIMLLCVVYKLNMPVTCFFYLGATKSLELVKIGHPNFLPIIT